MAPSAVYSPTQAFDFVAAKKKLSQPRVTDILRHAALHSSSKSITFIERGLDGLPSTIRISYPSLLAHATQLSRRISSLLPFPRHIVLAFTPRHYDMIVFFWAAALAGCVPTLLPPLNGDDDHQASLVTHLNTLLQRPLWIARSQDGRIAHLQSLLSGLDVVAAETLERQSDGVNVDRINDTVDSNDPAVYLLTSGSSGTPKAAMLSHSNIHAALSYKALEYQFSAGDVMLSWIGIDHAAGLVEAMITPMAAGLDQIHCSAPLIIESPLLLLNLASNHRVSHTFAPNFLIARLCEEMKALGPGSLDLSRLRRFTSGGESVPRRTAARFLEALHRLSPRANIVLCPGFGMTETCAGCAYEMISQSSSLDKDDGESDFTAIARFPSPSQHLGASLRVVGEDGRPLLAQAGRSVEGHLQVKGPMVFGGYFGMEEETRGAFTEDGWFVTGDLAVLRDQGERGRAFYLTGRAKETTIINGTTFHAAQLEAALANAPGIEPSFLLLTAYRPPGAQTESIAIFYAPTFALADGAAREATRQWVGQRLSLVCSEAPKIVLPLPREVMGKSTLGKLSRAKFRRELEGGEFGALIESDEVLRRESVVRAYVPPETEVERVVMGIVGRVLDVEEGRRLSVDASFFDLGASSLEVIRLRGEVIDVFGLPASWPAFRIMQHPTVRSLAAHIEEQQLLLNAPVSESNPSTSSTYTPLVPLNTTGSGTPLFMVHPGVGEILIFLNLARAFINDRPFYALRTRGFEDDDSQYPPFSSMSEMVDTYTTAILAAQPNGAIALAGYSYGGVVAFEIAKRLESVGRKVGFLGLINIPPDIQPRMREITYTQGLLNLAYFLRLITKPQATEFEADVEKAGGPAAQVAAVWRRCDAARARELDLSPEGLEKWVGVAQALVGCGRDYVPSGSVSAPTTVFYAVPLRGTKKEWLGQLQEWKRHVRAGEVRYVDVEGEHYTLMDERNVDSFQRHLRAEMVRAGV